MKRNRIYPAFAAIAILLVSSLALFTACPGTRPSEPDLFAINQGTHIGQGTIVITPAGPQEAGTTITVTATPASNFNFSGITVTPALAQAPAGTGNSRTFTMPAHNVTVIATFTAVDAPTFAITQGTHVGQGTIAIIPTGPQPAGAIITVTATPGTGYNFTGIAVSPPLPEAPTGTGNSRTFTMPANAVTVTATFVEDGPDPNRRIVFRDGMGYGFMPYFFYADPLVGYTGVTFDGRSVIRLGGGTGGAWGYGMHIDLAPGQTVDWARTSALSFMIRASAPVVITEMGFGFVGPYVPNPNFVNYFAGKDEPAQTIGTDWQRIVIPVPSSTNTSTAGRDNIFRFWFPLPGHAAIPHSLFIADMELIYDPAATIQLVALEDNTTMSPGATVSGLSLISPFELVYQIDGATARLRGTGIIPASWFTIAFNAVGDGTVAGANVTATGGIGSSFTLTSTFNQGLAQEATSNPVTVTAQAHSSVIIDDFQWAIGQNGTVAALGPTFGVTAAGAGWWAGIVGDGPGGRPVVQAGGAGAVSATRTNQLIDFSNNITPLVAANPTVALDIFLRGEFPAGTTRNVTLHLRTGQHLASASPHVNWQASPADLTLINPDGGAFHTTDGWQTLLFPLNEFVNGDGDPITGLADITITGWSVASNNVNFFVGGIRLVDTVLQQHAITINQPATGGTISGPAQAREGVTVTITAAPASGYTLESVTVTPAQAVSGTGNTRTFVMPGVPVTVTAAFAAAPTFAVNLPSGATATATVLTPGVTVNASEGGRLEIPATGGNPIGWIVDLALDTPLDASAWGGVSVVLGHAVHSTDTINRIRNLNFRLRSGATNADWNQATVTVAPVAPLNTPLVFDFAGFPTAAAVATVQPSIDGLQLSLRDFRTTVPTATDRNTGTLHIQSITFITGHAITVDPAITGGTIVAPSTAIAGSTVTITATPNAGYILDTITVIPTTPVTGITNTRTFVMPDAPVTVSATFVPRTPIVSRVIEDLIFPEWTSGNMPTPGDFGFVHSGPANWNGGVFNARLTARRAMQSGSAAPGGTWTRTGLLNDITSLVTANPYLQVLTMVEYMTTTPLARNFTFRLHTQTGGDTTIWSADFSWIHAPRPGATATVDSGMQVSRIPLASFTNNGQNITSLSQIIITGWSITINAPSGNFWFADARLMPNATPSDPLPVLDLQDGAATFDNLGSAAAAAHNTVEGFFSWSNNADTTVTAAFDTAQTRPASVAGARSARMDFTLGANAERIARMGYRGFTPTFNWSDSNEHAVLTFWARATVPGPFTVIIRNSNNTDLRTDFGINEANEWQQITVPLPHSIGANRNNVNYIAFAAHRARLSLAGAMIDGAEHSLWIQDVEIRR